MKKTITTLFSCIEGVGDGARRAGLEHVDGFEINPALNDIAIANGFNNTCVDILTISPMDYERTDVLHMSPVCKSFSNANPNKGELQLDIDCAKKCCEFIAAWEPQYITLENVIGYRGTVKKPCISYELIKECLYKHGYFPDVQVLSAADYGVPQSRRRLILRAIKGEMCPALPAPVKWIGWYEAIKDLVHKLPDSKFADWQLKRLPSEISESFLTESTNTSRMATVRSKDETSFTLTAAVCRRPISDPRAFLIHPTDQRTMPVREGSQPSFTLTTNKGGNHIKALLVENTGARSDRELLTKQAHEPCWTLRALGHDGHWHKSNAWLDHGRVVQLDINCLARLHSFSDDRVWSGKKPIDGCGIGNSVPPLMYQAIIENLLGIL